MALARVDLFHQSKTDALYDPRRWLDPQLLDHLFPRLIPPGRTRALPNPDLAEDSKTSLGYAAGLGLDLALNDRLFVGVEAKYQTVQRQFDVTPAGPKPPPALRASVPLGAFLLGATSREEAIKRKSRYFAIAGCGFEAGPGN